MRQFRPTLKKDPARSGPDLPPGESDDSRTAVLVAGGTLAVHVDVDWQVGEQLEILDKDWNVVCTATVQEALPDGYFVLQGAALGKRKRRG